MDNIDRFSKSFQNYQLDRTELQDNEQNARGAIPNSLADALVKANPEMSPTTPHKHATTHPTARETRGEL